MLPLPRQAEEIELRTDMSERASLQSLSNELIRQILDQIEPDPERTVPIDDRRFISVESFDLTPQPDASKDIGCFRLTCKRFADLGAPLLFTLVQIRFSRHGLKRLAQFAGWVHLTGHVKKFSYLMPYFYPNGDYRCWSYKCSLTNVL